MRVDIRHLIILISADHPAATAAAYIGVPTDTYRSWMRRGKGHRDYLMPHHVPASGDVYTCCRISQLLSVSCDVFRFLSIRPYLLEGSTRNSDWFGPHPASEADTQDEGQHADQDQGAADALDLLTQDEGQDADQDQGVADALDLLTQDEGQDADQDQGAADALDLLLQDEGVLFAGSLDRYLTEIEDDESPF